MSQLTELSIVGLVATMAFVASLFPRRMLSATALCVLLVPLLVWCIALLAPLVAFAGFSGENDNPVTDLDFVILGVMIYASAAVVVCTCRFGLWASRTGKRGIAFGR